MSVQEHNDASPNELELVEELTKLNTSLKVELEQCHKYITTLENDLNEAESKSNTSILPDKDLEITWKEERGKFMEDIQLLEAKVKEKRHLIKRL